MLKQKFKTPTSISRGLLLVISLAVLAVGLSPFVTKQKTALAATNGTINFQARLLTAAGNIVPDGQYNVEFKLYNVNTAGTALWTETRTGADKVTVKNGYLTVNLGSVTAFGGGINWDQELWLGMNIGGTGSPAWDGEMTPRLKLTSVPYAFRSGAVVSADGTSVLIAANGESGTICVQNSANCGFVQGVATDFIQNSTSPQTANINITSSLGTSTAMNIQGTSSASVPVAIIKGGATPGSAADVLQLQDSSNAVLFKVDNDGDAELARSLKVNYVSGVTNQLNIQGPSGAFVTVNSANNKFFIGEQADCGGRFCVAQNLSGTGGASYTNTYNSSITNVSSASTIIGQDMKISDTSSGVSNLIRAMRIDATGTTNTSATLNGIQIFIPTTSNSSTYGGNALQVQQANNTNIFKITNTGQATFQTTNNTASAFQILNSGGSAMFTLNTNGTNNGIYVSGTSGNAGGRIFFGSTGDTGVWIGESGSTDTNVLALNGNSGLDILVNNTSVGTFSSNGAFALQNSTDSNFAFVIKSQGDAGIMRVDSINRKIAIGNYSGTADDNIGAQLEILPVHDNRAALSIKGYSPTYVARYIDVKNSDGNDIFTVTANGDITTASGVISTLLQNGATSNSMSLISGNVTGSNASANSGAVTVRSGNNTAGATGALTLMSGNATGTGAEANTGSITIDSGSVAAGGSGTAGNIFIGTNNAPSIMIGNAARTQSINIGASFTTAANSTIRIASSSSSSNTQTVVIGSSGNAASSVSIEAGNTGGINIGTSATAHAINIGTGNATQTINLGSYGGSSKTTIQGGTIDIGSNTSTSIANIRGAEVNIGANGLVGDNTTINIGNALGGTQSIYIGNTSSSSSVAINGGTFYFGSSNFDHTIYMGTGAAVQTISIGSTNSSSSTNIYSGSGGTTFKSSNSAAAFDVLNASDVPLFTVDSSNSRVYIGNPTSDSTGALLVLDTKTGASDPTGVAGGMYYNSTLQKMRCYEGDGYWVDCRPSARSSYFFSTDFMGLVTGAAAGETLKAFGSTGAGHAGITGETGHPGIMQQSASTTTSTAYATMVTRSADGIIFGGGDAWRYETMVRIPILSDGANTFKYYTGFVDVDNNDSIVDGCFFVYSDGINSGRWQGACRSSSSGAGNNEATCNIGGSAVAAGQWYKLEVVVNSAGTSVDFKVDGVVKCTVTNFIPNTSGRGTGFGSILAKTTGSTTRFANIDYIEVNGQFSSAR